MQQTKSLIENFVAKHHGLLLNGSNINKVSTCNILLSQPRTYLHGTTSLSHPVGNERPMPTVYYYQNPFQWLKIKLQLLKLKGWDGEFNEKEFRRGSTYAISSVTNLVSHEDFVDLEGLLTPFALSKLRRDILILWNDDIIRNVGLSLSDIKLAVPTKVHIRTAPLSPMRICDIDMWYMAMKWRDMDALLIIDIVARFNRDFSNGQNNSEWTISFFELRKYHVQSYNAEKK